MSDWIASQRHWLSVERLPGYAPNLNPIENVWGNLKSQTGEPLLEHVAEVPTSPKTAWIASAVTPLSASPSYNTPV